ncbi:MAG TPA: hypothetical protein DDW19_01465 [Anaerolineaceae bacterium]|jgi:CRP-like cAMP-binding protein|nr:hypothetical protein [Anaerolineaceae bacterium]
MLKGEIDSFCIFQGLNNDQLELLAPLVSVSAFAADTVIFTQGDHATTLYLVISGQVEIRFKPYDGPPLTVSRLHAGDVFGWSSTIGRDLYTSSAISVTESQEYCINGLELHALCEQHPDAGVVILEKLASAIAENLEATHTGIMNILSQGMELGGPSSGKAT